MKQMHLFSILLITVLFSFALTACGNSASTPPDPSVSQSVGGSAAQDETPELVSNIKVVSKDTLLICFKDGTEITQTMEDAGRISA